MRLRAIVICALALSLVGTACRHASTAPPSRSPQLTNARLTGEFLMTLKVAKQSGLLRPISGGSAMWTFTPKCKKRACSVRWSVKMTGSKGTLRRSGGSYSGATRTPANIRSCHGAANKERVVVHIHVTDAAQSQGALLATKIAGTMSEKNSSSGCKTSMAKWTVIGVAQ
jgi:hypothetical protein